MTAGLWQNWVLPGIWITVQLLLYSAVLAGFVAFAVGMARTHRSRFVRFLAGFYTEIFRGTSALILMFWLFFVLPPLLGWQLVPMWAAVLALGLSYGAYGAEIVRGALNSVAPAQREAGVALSFSPWQRMRLILLPQAVPEMIPPFCNLLVELLRARHWCRCSGWATSPSRRIWCGSRPRRAPRSTPSASSSTSCSPSPSPAP